MNVYSSECSNTDRKMAGFLDKHFFVSLSKNPREALNTPVTEEEVPLAINSFKGGKASALVGFCSEFN